MYKFKRKLRLFKNDPFGLKERYFKWRLKNCIRKGIEIRTNGLKLFLTVATEIGIPRSEEEKEMLRKSVKRYDESIAEFEKTMKYARLYIEEEIAD